MLWTSYGRQNNTEYLFDVLTNQHLDLFKVANWIYEDDTDWKDEYMYVHIKEVFIKHRKIKQKKM